MKWFPSFGFQRRKRELQEEIDADPRMLAVIHAWFQPNWIVRTSGADPGYA